MARLQVSLVPSGQAAAANECHRGPNEHAYRKGFQAALEAVGLAFGLEPVGPVVQPGQPPAIGGLLWAEAPKEW